MDSSADTLQKYEEDYELLAAFASLAESESKAGIESDEFVSALILVGKLLNTRGEYLNALGYFIRGRAVLESREEQLHHLMSDLLEGIGEHYLLQGMVVESLPYFEKSLAVNEALCLGESVEGARLHMKAGEILCMQGELVDAKEHMLRAYQVLNAIGGVDHYALGEVCHNLGVILLTEDYYERAIDYLSEATKHRTQQYGEQSLERADSLWALGKCHLATKAVTPALEKFYEAIAIREEILGESDPLVIEAKEFYRSLSGEESASAPETTIVEVDSKQRLIRDHELVVALLAAASLALDKHEASIAGELIALARSCLESGVEIPTAISDLILSEVAAQRRS